MKRQALFWSLIILVALFLSSYFIKTTYAYFTDTISLDGSIKLQTGTLLMSANSKPEINLSKETESHLAIEVKNTGSLNGKITIKSIEAITNGTQLNNLVDYLIVDQQNPNNHLIDSQKNKKLNFKLIKKPKLQEQVSHF